MKWTTDKNFKIADVSFTIDTTPGSQRRESIKNNFTLVKTKSYIKDYLSLNDNFEHIIELGLFQGGSLVFFDKIFKPKKMVGLDIMHNKIDALETYIQDSAKHIKTYYNSSQGDETLLKNIVKNDLDGKLDLVVDDASHLYNLTKQSFTTLFPLLKPGGTYLIEDWAWSHRPNAQEGSHPWETQPALTNLIFEIIGDLGGNNQIESININNNMVIIKKQKNTRIGTSVLEKKYLRGKKLDLI